MLQALRAFAYGKENEWIKHDKYSDEWRLKITFT